ncbi:MAG: NAD-glutamate dehydrogenase [Kangiellaceae bacterium]|nr:NAD-glutamate dehydrogenase [Kangiellaceae bacterium]
MLKSNNSQDSVLFKNVLKQIDSKFRKRQAALVAEFARYFCTNITSGDVEFRSASDLYSPIVSLWRFTQESQTGNRVRVYSPELENDGWQTQHSVIELVHEDMPFLVDSVRMELNRMGIGVHLHIHLPMDLTRDKAGKITKIQRPSHSEVKPTITPMLLEIDRQLENSELELIRKNLEGILTEVRAAVLDWKPMCMKLQTVIGNMSKLPVELQSTKNSESKDFLQWISANHFTLLGYAYYELKDGKKGKRLVPKQDSTLGLSSLEQWKPKAYQLDDLPSGARNLILKRDNLLVLTKLSSVSKVHRPAHIDYVGIKRVNKKGEIVGEDRFIGLYTSAAYNINPMNIPVLRQKILVVQNESGLSSYEHDAKVLKNILETYPRDELFQTGYANLLDTSLGILQMQERSIVRLFIRRDPYGRFFSCLVYVPREIYNTKIRVRITEILGARLGATGDIQFTTSFSESVLARMYFIVPVENAEAVKYDLHSIEKDLQQAARSWEDNLKDALLSSYGEAEGKRLIKRYASGFHPGYQDDYTIPTAVLDIKHMELLSETNELSMLLYRSQEDDGEKIKFKLYYRNKPKPLSEIMPMLENMGLKVIGETPFKIKPVGGVNRWISDFEMKHAGGEKLDLEVLKDKFQDAFREVWLGDAENDGFNRLILSASLDWRETALLRAYAKYMWQIGSSFSQHYIEETLAAYPKIARQIVDYFYLKFDPKFERDSRKENVSRNRILKGLESVSNLDQDRILNRYLELIDVSTRTNFFQNDSQGKPKSYISIKLAPASIIDIPQPAPMFEIFVYSPKLEGVHLRGGKVARGGLRWSDRKEDFRTEILGLVKAQQVKNSVIVPVGAKGGFVCKRSLDGLSRDEFMAEGISCYKIFISALLDVTDNLVKGQLVPPTNVVRLDEDDPYLVVAADKGTATFSDIANGISEEYNFWLGDAFASGGSVGYDHKKMGITAKGAWESVKRHFMEMGIDCQTTEFTAVGVGDMAGDVFGNGMLCSRHTKLISAFNHMHIFIDPNPNAEESYIERERLFNLPRSSWEDYNAKLISKGGGIFLRSAKSIPLSKEIKSWLGVNSDSMTPNKLINSILKSDVDLLWNGGIGTYIKSRNETNSDVGDRANDNLRVNGEELNCKIIGEGGNLGVTQLGRIEYMLKGGRGNSDFIDNAGGVNCSDNEVNIKILLNQIVADGDMTEKQRNKLLLSMTDEVGDIVLRENFLQAQTISISEERSVKMVKELMRFIHWMEREGKINRELEFLPSDDELLERLARSQGFTRAELAVLAAYGKMILKEDLCTPDIANEPYYKNELSNYFPTALRKKFANKMQTHPLKNEIVSMRLANEMVDYLGSNFAFRTTDETGASASDVAICFTLSKEIFDMPKIWAGIESLDHQVPAHVKHNMFYQTQRMIRRSTRWFLRHRRKNLAITEGIEFFKEGIADLQKNVKKALDKEEVAAIQSGIDGWISLGVPKKLATKVGYLSTVFSGLDIVEMSKLTNLKVSLVGEVYYNLGAKLELHWFLDQITTQPVDNHWQAFARASFREELDWQQRSLTVAVLHMSIDKATAEERIIAWIIQNEDLLERWQQMVADFRASSRHEFAKFSVALRELLILVQSSIRAAAVAREDDFQ